jgi:hypothetical protein
LVEGFRSHLFGANIASDFKGIALNNSPVLLVYFRLLFVEKNLLGSPSGTFFALIRSAAIRAAKISCTKLGTVIY